jgi:ankyrin repeat protein
MTRTLLHAATDWPGHFPRVGESIAALVEAGADPDARFAGPHRETPLHWAASSDDVEALDALLDAGADIEADGAVLGGGPPMADAVGFGNWNAARRLRERGADTTLGDAAALGLMDRVVEHMSAPAPPTAEQVTMSLWHACHGGQRETAEYLIDQGGDPDWIGWDDLTTVDLANQGGHDDLAAWLRSRGAHTAAELR